MGTASTFASSSGRFSDWRNDSAAPALAGKAMQETITQRFTRAQLYRTLVGATSALLLCAIAVFAAAHHFGV
jgi:hypothetical protein